MADFRRKIGHCSVLAAELWVLRDSLQLCIDRNILCVEMEVDASPIIELLEDIEANFWRPLGNLICDLAGTFCRAS
ncbi:hypothetical protein RHMOL_Rhmol01G0294400 [Rhododendron molle]|uniref:Uncharacterized protein n=1 Tax=Rhododendron molle TaxID=49168 RepID=A0ACC0Q7B8_RHOML|nr:hypothetical protein RHMOL_Rhmol01G0294400 [Rhododendron molle]